MRPTIFEPFEAATDPAAEAPAREPDRTIEGLHYGLAWHRYRYCYRQAGALRILDAGSHAGASAVWAARLNPGASVLGVDASAAVVDRARGRAEASGFGADATVRFVAHDPSEPWPAGFGRFDFVVCRGLLARAADPDRLLANLARVLDPAGLLLVTLPSDATRQITRSLRQAVDALAPQDAMHPERVAVGLELVRALRPDHPIRAHLARPGRDPEQALSAGLADRNDWTLVEAAERLRRSGLTFLYAATPWTWRPDRVLGPDDPGERLGATALRLDPGRLSRLVDALDPGAFENEYPIYACPQNFSPTTPDWTTTRLDDPRVFERLIPEPTGLAGPAPVPGPTAQGRVGYQTVSGVRGELDRITNLWLSAVDGSTPCGEIERRFTAQTRASDDAATRQRRWIELADNGLIRLNPANDLKNLRENSR